MFTRFAPGGSAAFARFESSVMMTGPAIAAALHAVSSAPWIAPTFCGPKISARNAGVERAPRVNGADADVHQHRANRNAPAEGDHAPRMLADCASCLQHPTCILIRVFDDGIVVVMSDIQPKAITDSEFNRELVRALDDLKEAARRHGEEIQASIARSDAIRGCRRSGDEERGRETTNTIVRETPKSYGDSGEEQRLDRVDQRLDRVEQRLDRVDQRLDRIEQRFERVERTLTDISECMATKVELEATQENVKKMADGYMAIGRRLDVVADLLKPRFS